MGNLRFVRHDMMKLNTGFLFRAMESVILDKRAGSLANYPHAKLCNGLIYVSGISSRRPDNSWDGVNTTHHKLP